MNKQPRLSNKLYSRKWELSVLRRIVFAFVWALLCVVLCVVSPSFFGLALGWTMVVVGFWLFVSVALDVAKRNWDERNGE